MIPSKLINRLLEDERLTLVDVGAAGGLHTRWKPAEERLRLIGFEPLDEMSDDGAVLSLPWALGSADGSAELKVTKRVSMTSLLDPASDLISRFWDKPEHTKIVERIPVEKRRLDDLASEHKFDPDFIKIDVQGGEMDVLQGAKRCLGDSILAAEIELSFIERYSGLTKFSDVVSFMEGQGFELFDLWRIKRYRHSNRAGVVNPGTARGLRAGRLAFCDTLFVRRDDELLRRAQASRATAGKLIAISLIYGKADLAARLHDVTRDAFDAELNEGLDRYFKKLSGRQLNPRGLHRALDYFASKV